MLQATRSAPQIPTLRLALVLQAARSMLRTTTLQLALVLQPARSALRIPTLRLALVLRTTALQLALVLLKTSQHPRCRPRRHRRTRAASALPPLQTPPQALPLPLSPSTLRCRARGIECRYTRAGASALPMPQVRRCASLPPSGCGAPAPLSPLLKLLKYSAEAGRTEATFASLLARLQSA